MAQALYGLGRDGFANALVNWTSDTINVALVGAGYSANMATDNWYSSVVANVIGVPVALASKSSALGVCNAANVTFAAISTGSTITQIVIYKSTGVNGTSLLIAREDVTSTPTNGGTITLTWDSGASKIFQL